MNFDNLKDIIPKEKLVELEDAHQKLQDTDISGMMKNATDDEKEKSAEINATFLKYMNAKDVTGARRYLNHMKNELSSTNR